eukprot:TRINITY_DN8416_c0_g3_i2.p1 TRINITY_DN8416_c0_g3~~TRINITY_DN8416_c0_g3_i2.p1  ORF type:complete len:402 (-),score=17.90 TRINITY_DN8416_c0_g3_i2:512-1717(-)
MLPSCVKARVQHIPQLKPILQPKFPTLFYLRNGSYFGIKTRSYSAATEQKDIQNGTLGLITEETDVNSPSFQASIDFKFIRDNLDIVKLNCHNRNSGADPQKVVDLYENFLKMQSRAEIIRTARKENAKAMKGKMSKEMSQEQRQALVAKGGELKEQLSQIEFQLKNLETQLQFEGQRLPNLTHPSCPVGSEEEIEKVIEVVGTKPHFDFQVLNHIDISERLGLIDFDKAGQVSGSKFYYLKNQAALLEMALCNYTMQQCSANGYTPIITPDMVRSTVLEKCGFQPRASNTQVYSIVNSDLCLTGTAEVPLGGLYMNEVLDEKQLPIKLAAFGHCFRTEAGAAGAAGKGLYRVHQFSKVEMFVICTPSQSEGMLSEMLKFERDLYESLGLHFKIDIRHAQR